MSSEPQDADAEGKPELRILGGHGRRHTDYPRPGRMPPRRIPGTAVLAITNLIAATTIIYHDWYGDVQALIYLTAWAPPIVMNSLFLFAGMLLTAAVITRRWWVLNVGAGLSLFVWTATAGAILATWALTEGSYSPIALALAWWMAAGQAAMLFSPLLAGRFVERLESEL